MALHFPSPLRPLGKKPLLLDLTLTVVSLLAAVAAAAAETELHSTFSSASALSRERRGDNCTAGPLARFLQNDPDHSLLYSVLVKTSELSAMDCRAQKKGSAFVLLAPTNDAFTPDVLECMRSGDADAKTLKIRKQLVVETLRYLQIASLRVPVTNVHALRSNADEHGSLKTVLGKNVTITTAFDAGELALIDEQMAMISSDDYKTVELVDAVHIVSENVSVVRMGTTTLVPHSVATRISRVCTPQLGTFSRGFVDSPPRLLFRSLQLGAEDAQPSLHQHGIEVSASSSSPTGASSSQPPASLPGISSSSTLPPSSGASHGGSDGRGPSAGAIGGVVLACLVVLLVVIIVVALACRRRRNDRPVPSVRAELERVSPAVSNRNSRSTNIEIPVTRDVDARNCGAIERCAGTAA
ncbi:hypothetical protein CBR_g41312 [Chara braunii]|uniref:FAS1 domain-containing protein n=1 Tax=Chara braunii TaxID=69332 RepID=A0A388LVH6_CHABU|nr:hypothetical protein CBR_g41312 [Chara braunii]|eukprot:GBG86318.1 hypothetical protein CBR_g41312 [Chara braunii]